MTMVRREPEMMPCLWDEHDKFCSVSLAPTSIELTGTPRDSQERVPGHLRSWHCRMEQTRLSPCQTTPLPFTPADLSKCEDRRGWCI